MQNKKRMKTMIAATAMIGVLGIRTGQMYCNKQYNVTIKNIIKISLRTLL